MSGAPRRAPRSGNAPVATRWRSHGTAVQARKVNDMLTLGSTLVASAILLTALIALLFRRPNPPRWTRPDLVAMLIAVPVTGVLGLGLGYMLVGAYRLKSAFDFYEVARAVAVWMVAAAVWHVLGFRARLRAYAAADPASVIGPATSQFRATPPAGAAGSPFPTSRCLSRP